MKKKLALFFLFISCAGIFGQQKYFIYFKDKGVTPLQKIEKNSLQYNEAISSLTEKSIERRKKTIGADYIGYDDLPINQNYVIKLKETGLEIRHELKWFNCVSAEVYPSQLALIQTFPFVEKIEKVKIVKSRKEFETGKPLSKSNLNNYSAVSELNYGISYGQLQISEIPFVHSRGIDGEGVLIGLLDSGFNWENHPSLRNTKVVDEYDFVFNDSNTENESGDVINQDEHGTYVLSVIGGFAEGDLIGAAYNSNFILAKTEDLRSETSAEEDNFAAALEWLEAKGADIVTSSLGYNSFDDETESYEYSDMDGKTTICTKAIEVAFKKGVVTVNSAGNEGNYPWRYITAPADGFNVIAVGGIAKDSTLYNSSSRGPTYDGRIKPELVANGVDVYGAEKYNGGYRYASGTSAAAPIVAGTAGLLLSTYPHLTNQQVRKILIESCSQAANPDNNIGYGIMSAKRAIGFPNLQSHMNSFSLNKIFIEEDNIDTESVWLYFSNDSENFDSLKMNASGGIIFTTEIPAFGIGENIEFYFSFIDENGTKKIEPSNSNYAFEYGSLEISLNTGNFENLPKDFYLSQNYPNPFNSHTTIEYSTVMLKNVKISIYNILGQKIKELFNGQSNPGINYTVWNGLNDDGIPVGSGPYIYTLETDGNLFVKKMIYLK